MIELVHHDPRLGTWVERRFGAFACALIAFLLVLGSVRGFIVLHSPLSSGVVYQTTSACLLTVALYGYVTRRRLRHPDWALLKKLLQLNLVLGVLNVAVDLAVGGSFELSFLYLYLAPYALFVFLRVPDRYLVVAAMVIAVAIGYSVCDNFFTTLSGPEGLQRVMDYNARLRPDTFEALSRTGEFFRAGGYTGSYHDSANILGMAASFFGIRFLIRRNLLDLGVFLFSLVSLTLTQSAANIVVAILTIGGFACYTLLRRPSTSTYVYMALAAAAVVALGIKFGDFMTVFTARVGRGGDWSGMANQLTMGDLFAGLPFVLVGHAAAFGNEVRRTEVALLKLVVQLGAVHAAILFWLTLYPVYRFVRTRGPREEALPAVAATTFGFFSLLHYGSLFRATSVFLFFAFFAMVLVRLVDGAPAAGPAAQIPVPAE